MLWYFYGVKFFDNDKLKTTQYYQICSKFHALLLFKSFLGGSK